MKKITLLIFVVCFISTISYGSQDFLVLSGGISPKYNNYSNYRQTIILSEFLIKKGGEESVSIMFGAGNVINGPLHYPDVHKAQKLSDNKILDSMVYGALRKNTPATEKNVKKILNDLLNSETNDPLFIFISDHGFPNVDDPHYSDNCMALWGYEEETMKHTPFADICFSRKEMEKLIREKNTQRRILFVMTQCYSGGFHKMSVKMEAGFPTADSNICGFTSSTKDAMASGCSSDADGTDYNGYERYFTEQLTGQNIVTGGKIPDWVDQTISEAHLSASLKDLTIDVPLSTTDYYLKKWSEIIKKQSFIPRTNKYDVYEIRELMEKYTSLHFNDIYFEEVEDDLLKLINEKYNHLQNMQLAVSENLIDLSTVLESSKIGALRQKYLQITGEAKDLLSTLQELQKEYKLHFDVVEWFWRESILKGEISILSKEEIEFEIDLLPNLERPYLFFLSKVTKTNREYADIISHYQAQVYNYMINHALTNGGGDVKVAAERLEENLYGIKRLKQKYQLFNQRAGLLRRIILMREQLAALVILVKSGDQKAINDIRNLENCIHTEPSFSM